MGLPPGIAGTSVPGSGPPRRHEQLTCYDPATGKAGSGGARPPDNHARKARRSGWFTGGPPMVNC